MSSSLDACGLGFMGLGFRGMAVSDMECVYVCSLAEESITPWCAIPKVPSS